MAGLAGTAVGDLFVFGDIRDAVREGSRYAAGEQADQLMLGLACRRHRDHRRHLCDVRRRGAGAGRADAVKVARKTGSLGAELAGNIGRMVRQAGFSGASPVLRGACRARCRQGRERGRPAAPRRRRRARPDERREAGRARWAEAGRRAGAT